MNATDEFQIDDAIRKALVGRAATIRPAEAVTDSSPTGSWRRWLPALVAAAVIAVTSAVVLVRTSPFTETTASTSTTSATAGPDYTMYRGHRWFLTVEGTPVADSGYLDLGVDDKIVLWNTQQQLIGRYTIEPTGQLKIQWTGLSSGKTTFNQAIVDILSPLGNNVPAFIRSTDPTVLALDVESQRLTFTDQ